MMVRMTAPVAERITIGLLPKTAKQLEDMKTSTGMSKADIVNRAITLYEYVTSSIEAGDSILIRRADGQLEQLRLI